MHLKFKLLPSDLNIDHIIKVNKFAYILNEKALQIYIHSISAKLPIPMNLAAFNIANRSNRYTKVIK